MPQSRLPMPTPPNPHANLERRLQIIDLLTIVMLPGGIVACSSAEPKARAVVFVCLFLLSLAGVWWGTTIAHTYGIRTAWKRVLIHLYAFMGFACFLLAVPACVALFVGFLNRDSWRDVLQVSGGFVFCTAMTGSMLLVERRRIRAAESAASPVLPPQNTPTPPTLPAGDQIPATEDHPKLPLS